MANSAARIFLKNGKSFPQHLGSRLVGLPCPSSNVVNKHPLQLLAQPLISQNPTQQQQYLYLQRPASGSGFNFVDFVLGNEGAAREGKMRLVSRRDEDEDGDGESDHVDDEDDFDDDEDDEPFDDGGNHYSSGDEYYNCCNVDEDDDTK